MAVNSRLVAIARFARALHRDVDAVRKCHWITWSNRQAEGQITA